MAINPESDIPGKVEAASSEYPYGKAQDVSAVGAAAATPLLANWLNDVFGLEQYLLNEAGITPSGTPDNAESSQYFEAIWNILNVRSITHNMASDADYTLTDAQNLYKKIVITDTGVVLTTARNIVVDDIGKIFSVTNSTAQDLTFKTAAGTGITVVAGESSLLMNDGINVLNITTSNPINDNDIANKQYVDGTLDTSTNGYQILPSGLIMQWGVATAASGTSGTGTVTYPITFPNDVFFVSPVDISTTVSPTIGTTITNNSSFDYSWSGAELVEFNFYAIGY